MTTLSDRPNVVTPADWVPGPKQGDWTYKHYAALPDDEKRYEIVGGVLYMTPAPSVWHQNAVLWLSHYLLIHVQVPGMGRVCIAPIDVELSPREVVQPDVIVILREHFDRITPSRIIGAPDLVIGVSSPGTVVHDIREKQDAYARAGVPEYWLVDPLAHTIQVLSLEGNVYHSQGVFSKHQTLPSQVVPAIGAVHVEQFFA